MRALCLCLLAGTSCFAQNATPPANRKAPEIEIHRLLQAPDGASLTLARLRGKAVVLEFWATWCGPCVAAIPHLNAMAAQFKEKPVVFLSITDEAPGVVQVFLEKRALSGWVGLDADGATFAKYGVLGRPQTILIDAQGVLRKATDPEKVTASVIDDLIAGKSFVHGAAPSK